MKDKTPVASTVYFDTDAHNRIVRVDILPDTKLQPGQCDNTTHEHRTVGIYTICDIIARYWAEEG